MATLGQTLTGADRLFRTALSDRSARRTLVALLVLDGLYVGAVVAKALGLIWFDAGAGNVLVASQFALVMLAVVVGWLRQRDAVFASLTLVAAVLLASKLMKPHNHLGKLLDGRILPPGLSDTAIRTFGMLGFAGTLVVVLGGMLLVVWRSSTPTERVTLLLIGLSLALVSGISVVADALGILLHLVLGIDQGLLSRAEQGLELVVVSVVLALTVGIVRVRCRARQSLPGATG